MTLTIWLRLLLGLQILLYTWAMAILYSSTHDGVSNFNGLYALIPFGLFGVFCITNLVLLCAYLPKTIKKKRKLDLTIVIFSFISIALICLYHFISQWALGGPG